MGITILNKEKEFNTVISNLDFCLKNNTGLKEFNFLINSLFELEAGFKALSVGFISTAINEIRENKTTLKGIKISPKENNQIRTILRRSSLILNNGFYYKPGYFNKLKGGLNESY